MEKSFMIKLFTLLLLLSSCCAAILPAADKREKFVSYEDFGAIGDGKTDDQQAIAQAHAYANRHNLPVKARAGAKYYIGGGKTIIYIRTDTDFNNAEFIIDDRNAADYLSPIFRLDPDKENHKIKTLKKLYKSQKKLDMTFPGDVLLLLRDNKRTRFNRLRSNRKVQKSPQRDVVLVDQHGMIDKSTPLLWDFDNITECIVHHIPERTLTVKNGIFTTIADSGGDRDIYKKRNFLIQRSNVVFDNIVHKVQFSSTVHSYMTNGFLSINKCANITVKNSAFTGHKLYPMVRYPQTLAAGYDLTLYQAVNVKFINCRQLNDIYDNAYWGIMGSNYCKNLLYENCSFSRFDAHMGVYNATIRNCTLGHQGISVTGFGTLLVENTSVKSRYFINLRADYGSFWQGKVIIRNCQYTPLSHAIVIGGANRGNHDFGYTCYMPETIEIENFTIHDKAGGKLPALLANFNTKYNKNYQEKYPYIKTKLITVKNLKTNSKNCILSPNKYMFKSVKLIKK